MWLIVLYCVCLLVFSILCSACIVCIPWSISRTKQWEAKPLREQRAFPQLAHAIISQNFMFHSFFKTTSVTQSFNKRGLNSYNFAYPYTWLGSPTSPNKNTVKLRRERKLRHQTPQKTLFAPHRSFKASSKRWTVFIMRPSWEERQKRLEEGWFFIQL